VGVELYYLEDLRFGECGRYEVNKVMFINGLQCDIKQCPFDGRYND
jgi:hypothetical protein